MRSYIPAYKGTTSLTTYALTTAPRQGFGRRGPAIHGRLAPDRPFSPLRPGLHWRETEGTCRGNGGEVCSIGIRGWYDCIAESFPKICASSLSLYFLFARSAHNAFSQPDLFSRRSGKGPRSEVSTKGIGSLEPPPLLVVRSASQRSRHRTALWMLLRATDVGWFSC